MSNKSRGWFSRNWKWLIPVGCLGPALLFACIVGFVLWLVFGVLTSSPPYQQAMALAQQDQRATAALGSPVEGGRFVSGNITVNNDTGHAELVIPVSGPKGAGKLDVVADKSGERWVLEQALLTVDGTGETIDLLENLAEDL